MGRSNTNKEEEPETLTQDSKVPPSDQLIGRYMQRLLIFSTVLILEGQFQTIMSHETRQPTTVIEFETPYNAAWSGRHRNDVEIQQSITNAIQAIAATKSNTGRIRAASLSDHFPLR